MDLKYIPKRCVYTEAGKKISSAILDEQGKPNESLLLGDGLHMTQEGYELWSDIVEPYLID